MPGGTGKKFKPSKYIPVSAAAIFLVGATTLFFVFTCPWLAHDFSTAIPVYNGVIFLFVLANFSMATFMDPGIFPRAEEDEDKEDDFRAPLYKNVEIKGIQVRMKWCSTCRFYRPPRCSHCSVCDNCVEEFDHHCPWVNNCIGRRNYRYFFLFLLSLTTHIIGVFGFGFLFVLYHRDDLSRVHTAVTMAVMSVAGLFFVPVAGLTGFHIVLVARGRTTNEQKKKKKRNGLPPLPSPPLHSESRFWCVSCRYLGRPKREQTVVVSPPFLRPEVSDGHITVKLTDNGIEADLKRSKSKGSLEIVESQSADAEPAPPPKPDLSRYTGLRSQLKLSTNEESTLLPKKENPPTPTMYKYRLPYNTGLAGAGQGVFPHSTSAKLMRGDSLKDAPCMADSNRNQNYRSEPSLEPESFRSPTFGKSFHFDPLSSGSRSSSLKSAQGTGFELGALQSIRSEGTTSTSYKSLANQTRNGSLSYDSLLTPSESPDFESVQAGSEPLGYTSPYLSARITQQREADLHRFPGSYTVLNAAASSSPPLPPPHAREPSPVRYDNLSRQIMASMHERERLLHEAESGGQADSGIQSTPGSGSHAPRTSSSSDDSKRSPPGRAPSRENLAPRSVPRFGRPPGLRVRSLGSPEHTAPYGAPMAKSVSYSSHKASPFASTAETAEGGTQPLLCVFRDEVQMKVSYSKTNGQPKSLAKGESRTSPSPGATGHPAPPLSSPTRGGGVKKVSGVGGTTYEISV
uniref:Palmitoyltransferase n=1 Tax=Latimeria chalumnae TaxID=7897 RepID=H3A4C7_LATCH